MPILFSRGGGLPVVLLLTSGLTRAGLALHASSSQTGEAPSSNGRLFRNPDQSDAHDDVDVMQVELDSRGKGRLGAAHDSASVLDASSDKVEKEAVATDGAASGAEVPAGPQLINGGFEVEVNTDDYKYAKNVPGWSTIGSGAMFIKTGSAAFGNVAASHGDYLMGLMGEGSGVFQSVGGHEVGKWYRLMFHSAYRTAYGEAKLKVSVDATEKFNEAVYSGTLGWYEVTYKAPYPDIVITFEHGGPSGDRTVFIDGIDVKPVEMWDTAHGNSHSVLLQKVNCAGDVAPDTCSRGRFLAVGDYDEDGATSIVEVNAASQAAVWVALHEGTRWSFKSASLNQGSPASDSGPPRTANMWYLHSDYSVCEARNWFTRATSSFDVKINSMGLHELEADGTECGSLFAISKFENAQTVVTR